MAKRKSRKCLLCGVEFHIDADNMLACGMCSTFGGRRAVLHPALRVHDCPRKPSGVGLATCESKCKFHEGTIVVNIVKDNATRKRRSGTKTIAVRCGRMKAR